MESEWVNLVWDIGFVGSGATLCAGLLDFGANAYLTNYLVASGFTRWCNW